MRQKVTAVILSILFLFVSGCANNSEKSSLKVIIGKDTISSYRVDTAKNNSTPNNKDFFKQKFSKALFKSIKYINNYETVILDFGSDLPDKVIVNDSLLNSVGEFLYTDKETDVVPLTKKDEKYSFILKKHWASALNSVYKKDKTNFRGFKVTANWGKKVSVYAFIIKTDGY